MVRAKGKGFQIEAYAAWVTEMSLSPKMAKFGVSTVLGAFARPVSRSKQSVKTCFQDLICNVSEELV
jgi:hypothetical protein